MQEVFENLSEAEKSLMKELEVLNGALEKVNTIDKIKWISETYARLDINADGIESGEVLSNYYEIGGKIKNVEARFANPAAEAAA